jgi:Mg2+ and Co2+ transporter CorA
LQNIGVEALLQAASSGFKADLPEKKSTPEDFDDVFSEEIVKKVRVFKTTVEDFDDRLQKLKDRYETKIDEQRNSLTWILTWVTILLFPMSFYTGYFGMNFDNMAELNSATYPSIPGVHLMWVLLGTTYGLILVGVMFNYGYFDWFWVDEIDVYSIVG